MKKLPCRVCLKTDNPSINMLANPLPIYDEKNVTILEMFAVCTEVALVVGDNSVLCIKCEDRLIEAYKFRTEAQNAVALLETVQPLDETSIKEELDDFKVIEKVEAVIHEEESLIEKQTTKKRNPSSTIPLPPGTLNRFNCRYCFAHIKHGLKHHESQHIASNGGLECHHCGKKFRIRNHLMEHIRSVHFTDKSDPNRIRYTCDLCERSYSEKASLRNHKRDKHSDNPKIIEKVLCPLCGKAVRCLPVHIYHVHETHTMSCDICQKQFKSKNTLKAHMRTIHLANPEDFKCPECGKCFKAKAQLKDHLNRVHYTTERKYECNICFTKFKSQQSHRFHMKMHRASLDFCCDICGAGFKTKAYMLQHMKTHSDVKDFECEMCGKKFKRSGQLAKHKLIHQEHQYFCEFCPNESFIDASTLRMHKEKVHLGIRYRCDCGKEYGMKKHLRQHQTAQGHDRNKWTRVVPETGESQSGYWSSSNH